LFILLRTSASVQSKEASSSHNDLLKLPLYKLRNPLTCIA
jgi:hypothetical protein